MALGSAMPHTACQSDSAVLKSDAREKRGFPSQGAFLLCVQSAPSDFAVACAGLFVKNGLVSRTGSSSGFSDGQSPGSEVRSEHKRSKANDSTEREENPRRSRSHLTI